MEKHQVLKRFGLDCQPQHGKHTLDSKHVIIVRSPNLCLECWEPLHKDSNRDCSDYLRKWRKTFSGSDMFFLYFQPQHVRANNFFRERRRLRRGRKRRNKIRRWPLWTIRKKLSSAAALQEFFSRVCGWRGASFDFINSEAKEYFSEFMLWGEVLNADTIFQERGRRSVTSNLTRLYNIYIYILYIYIYIYLFHYFYRCEIVGWQGHCLIFTAAGASKRTFPFLWSCLICQLSPGRSLGMSLLRFGDRSFLFHPRERTARRLHNPQRCSLLWCQAPSVPMQPPPPLSGGSERRYGWSSHFSALCRRWRLVSPTLLPVLFFSKLYLHLSGSLLTASHAQLESSKSSHQATAAKDCRNRPRMLWGQGSVGGRIFRAAGLKFEQVNLFIDSLHLRWRSIPVSKQIMHTHIQTHIFFDQ